MISKRLSLAMIAGGAVLSAYAIGAVVVNRIDGGAPTFSWLAQTGACLALGLGCACGGVFAQASKAVGPTPERDPQFDPLASTIIKPEAQRDLCALHYLAQRLQKSPEALALCKQMQDCIFELHHGVLLDSDSTEQTFSSSVKVKDGGVVLTREYSAAAKARHSDEVVELDDGPSEGPEEAYFL